MTSTSVIKNQFPASLSSTALRAHSTGHLQVNGTVRGLCLTTRMPGNAQTALSWATGHMTKGRALPSHHWPPRQKVSLLNEPTHMFFSGRVAVSAKVIQEVGQEADSKMGCQLGQLGLMSHGPFSPAQLKNSCPRGAQQAEVTRDDPCPFSGSTLKVRFIQPMYQLLQTRASACLIFTVERTSEEYNRKCSDQYITKKVNLESNLKMSV